VTTDTESAEATPETAPAADPFNTQMQDAARAIAAELGLEPEGGDAEPLAEATTEAAAEPAPAVEPEAVDEAPPVEEAEPAPDIDDIKADYFAKLAAKDALIRELEAKTKAAPQEPDPIALAIQSRDPGKALAALQASGLTFEALAQHVIDNPGGVPDAAPEAAPNPLEERLAQLEAQLKQEADAKQQAEAARAVEAQQVAVTGHLASKSDQFPLLVELGRSDLVLGAMRDAHGGKIPAFKTDAEAALVVEQSAKRVEKALADELAGYAKGEAVKNHLTKILGLTAPPAAAPTRTGTRDGGSTDAPVAISNETASQRASLGVDDEPDEEELMRRVAAGLQERIASVG
jgi:hypothetical protein